MARVTVEDCLPLVDNRFALVLLATKRARQLMAGARPLIEAKDKPPVLALREVATGKVRFDRPVRAALEGQYDNEKLPAAVSPARGDQRSNSRCRSAGEAARRPVAQSCNKTARYLSSSACVSSSSCDTCRPSPARCEIYKKCETPSAAAQKPASRSCVHGSPAPRESCDSTDSSRNRPTRNSPPCSEMISASCAAAGGRSTRNSTTGSAETPCTDDKSRCSWASPSSARSLTGRSPSATT